MGGANAHVIVEEAPAPAPAAAPAPQPSPAGAPRVRPFLVSGVGEGLAAQAASLASFVDRSPDLSLDDLGMSLATTRSHLAERGVVLAADRAGLAEGLAMLAEGSPAADVVRGSARPGDAVFVFPGQGGQWAGMATALWDTSPVFADSMAACEAALADVVDWSLAAVLRGAEGAPPFERVDVVQPCLWAVMVSLAALWRSYGVEPAAVVGHSQGEIAAATVAGGLSLADGARVVALRSLAVRDVLAGHGTMASISERPEAVEERLGPLGGEVSIAAVNGPSSVVVSGETEAVVALVAQCEADGVWARRIPVDYASHSPQVDALRDRLLVDLAAVRPRSGDVPMFSTVTGTYLDTAEMDAAYWYRGLRAPVRFADAVRSLADAGAAAFVEVSPHPGLTVALQDGVGDASVSVLGTLRRDRGDEAEFARALAHAHAAGLPVDWAAYWEGTGARRTALPTYAFQRQRYWLDAPSGGGDLAGTGLAATDHPFLAAAVRLAGRDDEWLFTGHVSPARDRWLADHRVDDTTVVPSGVFLDLALAVGREVGCDLVEELVLGQPLALDVQGAAQLQVRVGAPEAPGFVARREVGIYTRPDTPVTEGIVADVPWACHARGVLVADVTGDGATAADWRPAQAWPPAGAEPVDVGATYDRLAEAGFAHGPAFERALAAWRRGDETFAEVSLDEERADQAVRFAVHPILLTAALHVASTEAIGDDPAGPVDALWEPASWRGARVRAAGASKLRVHLAPTGDASLRLLAVDPDGVPVIEVAELATRPFDAAAVGTSPLGRTPSLFGVDWIEVPLPEGETDGESAPSDLAVVTPASPAEALDAVASWLDDGDAVADRRLVIVTRGAIAVRPSRGPRFGVRRRMGPRAQRAGPAPGQVPPRRRRCGCGHRCRRRRRR